MIYPLPRGKGRDKGPWRTGQRQADGATQAKDLRATAIRGRHACRGTCASILGKYRGLFPLPMWLSKGPAMRRARSGSVNRTEDEISFVFSNA